jgi:hypothetical protein
VFCRWQKELIEKGVAAFQSKERREVEEQRKRIEFLERKVPDLG